MAFRLKTATFIFLKLQVNNAKKRTRGIILAAILIAFLVVQEEVLTLIPNVQLTVMLIMLYAYFMPYEILLPLILAYVIIDNMFMGSLNLLYTPAMVFAWMFLGVISRLIRNKKDYILVLFALFFGFFYGWTFIPAQMLTYGIKIFWPYFVSDLPAEIIMAINNVVTVIFLYFPLRKMVQNNYPDVFELYQ